MSGSRHKRNRQKMAGATMALLITALFAAALSLVLWKRTAAGSYASMGMDTNARPAGEKEMPPDPEEILEQIRKEAEETSFRFKINSEPNFTSPEAEGDLCIIDSPENTFYMRVVVTDGSGRELYRSRELKPGGQEMTGELKEVLETGKHPATATAYAIDPGTGTTVGSVETGLIITIGGG